jgi:hypothetical protein
MLSLVALAAGRAQWAARPARCRARELPASYRLSPLIGSIAYRGRGCMGTGHRSDWSKCGHAGDDHMGDARRIAPRLIERGPVGDRGGIEDRNVGGEARPQRAAVDEPHRGGAGRTKG